MLMGDFFPVGEGSRLNEKLLVNFGKGALIALAAKSPTILAEILYLFVSDVDDLVGSDGG